MTGWQPRWLSLAVTLAVTCSPAGCGGDSHAATSSRQRERTAANATATTLTNGADTRSPADPVSAGLSPSTTRPRAPGSTTGVAATPGPTTTVRSSESPSTTGGPDNPATTSPDDPYAPGPCPDARTCTEHKLYTGRWPRDANGNVTIHYKVNPTNTVRPQFSDAEFIAAVRAAFQTWADAVPRLRFVYDGTTTAKPGEGNNVVGFGPLSPTFTAHTGHAPNDEGPTYTGFGITISQTYAFSLRPCDPKHGQPCTDDNQYDKDLQGLLTHETGHLIGLDHPADPVAGSEQSVSPNGNPNGRSACTLAKGDVIGARELTGTPKTDPMPVIYRP